MRKYIKQFIVCFIAGFAGSMVLNVGISENNNAVMVLGLSIIGIGTAASVMVYGTHKKRGNVGFEDTIKH